MAPKNWKVSIFLGFHLDSVLLGFIALVGLAFALSPLITGNRSFNACLISYLAGGIIIVFALFSSLGMYAHRESSTRELVQRIKQEGITPVLIARSRLDPGGFGMELEVAAKRAGMEAELGVALREYNSVWAS